MSMIIYPLGLPRDFYKQVRKAAKETGLSMADIARQAMKRGLPLVREEFGASGRVTNVNPLPRTVLDGLYADREDDMASIRRLIKAQPRDAE
jgi:hypothetical protein